MRKSFFYLVTVLSFVSLLSSCSRETEVGSGLLGTEDLSVDFKDDFIITAKTVQPASIVTYFPIGYQVNSHIIGEINDPIFGKSTSSASFVPYIPTGLIGPNLVGATFDSLVLYLNIDTTFFYGDIRAVHDIEVYRLTERIPSDTVFSDNSFALEATPIATKTVRVGLIDSIDIPAINIAGTIDSTTREANLLSITLDEEFGRFIYDNVDNFSTTEDIQTLINGLEVRSSADNSMFAIDLRLSTFTTFRNSVSLYYRDSSNTKRIYPFPFGSTHPITKKFTHDLTDSPISSLLDQNVLGSEPLYLKGIGGPKVLVDISDAKQLEGTLVNFASLEFYVAMEDTRDTILYPEASFIAIQSMDSGQLTDILDLVAAKSNSNQIEAIFGGRRTLDDNLKVYKYKMNITTYVKEMIKGRSSGEIFLTVLDEIENPRTAILFGPNHPTLPAKLNITYTNP